MKISGVVCLPFPTILRKMFSFLELENIMFVRDYFLMSRWVISVVSNSKTNPDQAVHLRECSTLARPQRVRK